MRYFWRGRRGTIAILFAVLALPLIGGLGLAIDYAQVNQTYSMVSLAAHSAALNAIKVAATGSVNGDANYVTEATTAATDWFNAQIGHTASIISNLQTQVTITPGPTITATMTVSGQISSRFGKIFGIMTYPVNVSAQATIDTAPYLEVVVLLDNSSSMAMGASTTDMTSLLSNSPCDLSNAFTTTDGHTYTQASNNDYGLYQCSYYGPTYDGQLMGLPACPLTVGSISYPTAARTATMGPACSNKVNGYTAYAGPPCAFACHWDNSKAAGLGNDLWAMARRSGLTLRTDLLKNATNSVIAALKSYNQSFNNLSVGVYTFASTITQIYPVYPASGEAGSDFDAAQTAVGSPPTPGSGAYTETGIQPIVAATSGDNNNTNFVLDMASLATNNVTSAGNGASAASPRKILILMTDGIADDYTNPTDGSQARYPMPSSACQQFKDMGYQVYVVYTPYYPITHIYYLYYMMGFNESTGSDSVTYNLQQCSSSTGASDLSNYYIAATDQASINTAVKNFIKSALTNPARYTK
jgi:Flp pilus assembly protein TadG